MNQQKLYVVIRNDLLTESHKAVQGGHALAELLLKHKLSWTNGTLIYLSVENEKQLKKLYRNLPCKKKATFREPYWGNSVTAIAAYGRKLPEFLKKLPLL